MPRRTSPLAVALAALCTFAGAEEKPAAPPQSQLTLVRYDLPRGRSDGYAPTRQSAQRKEGADGVDWPGFSLGGQPLWADRSEALIEAILAAMLGWQPTGATGVCILRRSQLIDASGGVFRYEITFSADHDLRII